MTEKMKRTANLRHGKGKRNFRCVIGEDRYDGRWLRFNVDGTITRVQKSSRATIFSSIQAAEKAMENYGVEDFGLTFFPVTNYSGFTSANRNQGRERLPQIIIDEISRETVKEWIWQDPTFSLNDLEDEYIVEHSRELKSEIIVKISKLIDVHQVADYFYAKSKSSTDSNIEYLKAHECQGCNICDEIQEMAAFLDRKEMSKFFHVVTLQDTNRKERYDTDDIEELAHMYKDFVPLRVSGYSMKTIGKFYGLTEDEHRTFFDRLANSPYHEVIGRNKRGLKRGDKRTLVET